MTAWTAIFRMQIQDFKDINGGFFSCHFVCFMEPFFSRGEIQALVGKDNERVKEGEGGQCERG